MNHISTALLLASLAILSACDSVSNRSSAPPQSSAPEAPSPQPPPPQPELPPALFTLQVTVEGPGAGSVSSAPSGVNCGNDCSEDYASGTTVTLTASADSGATFLGWGGACAGTDTCVVTMDSAKSVSARFGLETHTLTVSKAGAGTGTVTSAPAGIACGADCVEDYAFGTEVTLTASADSDSEFAGWSGSACSGTDTCTVTMNATSGVTATFTLKPAPAITASVGGSVFNLSGTLVLQNNGGDDLALNADGSFVFSTLLNAGTTYNVTVLTQPDSQSCTVSDGAGVVGHADITDVTVTCSSVATSLSVSTSRLALSVNNPAQHPALSGAARDITLSNTGVVNATNLVVTFNGLPAGTSTSSTCADVLAPGASCTVTVTPGPSPTSACNTGIAPIPGAALFSASNAAAVTTDLVVLTHGCQYQGGFIYAIDDTTPSSVSIGGRVTSLVDQAGPGVGMSPQSSPIIWSSNGAGGSSVDVSFDIIPGTLSIDTLDASYWSAAAYFSVTYTGGAFPALSDFAPCDSATDGACNTHNIVTFYDAVRTNYISSELPPFAVSSGPTNTKYYAAGLCTETIDNYSDWYLPAVCEVNSAGVAYCPPDAQSISGTLGFLLGDPWQPTPRTSCSPPAGADCLAGPYWTSTSHVSLLDAIPAMGVQLSTSSSLAVIVGKSSALGARCSRKLTN